MEREDIDGLAGEFVLGTLTAAERASVSARRQREPQLNDAITIWENHLAPLNEAIAEIEPPSGVLQHIHSRISAQPRAATDIAALRRGVRFWRGATLAASLVAAGLVGFVGVRELTPKPPSRNLVAVLQKDAASPAFLVTVNVDDRLMTVKAVAAQQEVGKSFELWIIHDTLGPPKSLGVIDGPRPIIKPTFASYQTGVIEEATYAVTLEPEGGSASGAPTGQVLFSGKLIATDR